MKRAMLGLALLGLTVVFIMAACCSKGPASPASLATIDPSNFTEKVDAPYFPLTAGIVSRYTLDDPEGKATIEMAVTDRTRSILGVKCVVVTFKTEFEGNGAADVTESCFAQDAQGDIWNFGQDSRTYLNGKEVARLEPWEAGKNGSKPGIVVKRNHFFTVDPLHTRNSVDEMNAGRFGQALMGAGEKKEFLAFTAY